MLDGAALTLSTVDIPRDVQAEFCLRAGYLCMRRIAACFKVRFDPDPAPGDTNSVTRAEWEAVVAGLDRAGVPLNADRDQAWRDFAGWRVNYDTVLLSLAGMTMAPYSPWSSDRSPTTRGVHGPHRPPVRRRRARRRAHDVNGPLVEQ